MHEDSPALLKITKQNITLRSPVTKHNKTLGSTELHSKREAGSFVEISGKDVTKRSDLARKIVDRFEFRDKEEIMPFILNAYDKLGEEAIFDAMGTAFLKEGVHNKPGYFIGVICKKLEAKRLLA